VGKVEGRAASGRARHRHRSHRLCKGLLLACSTAVVFSASAHAQEEYTDELFEQNRTTYGDIGLIEMPSARMAPDGQMSLTAADIDASQWRIGLGFQMLPWLETSFRYAHIPHFFDNGDPLFDRSFGIKVRLFQETPYTPALAIGARDIVGTGVYGQEFVVLSKRYRTIDFTAGLGWGRLASTEMFPNPLGKIFPSFDTRAASTGQGGTVSFNELFHGPDTSLFGGINWQTPIDRLNLLVEYSSDRYLQERRNTHFFTRMPVNIAADYRVFDHVSLMAGWLYGTTWGAALTIHFNPTEPLFDEKIGTAPMPAAIRNSQQRQVSLDDLNRQNQITPVNAGGLGLNLAMDPADVKEIISAAPSSAARDFEIDGHTLTINVDGPTDMNAQCRIFAQIAAASIPGIDTVAITELADHDGNVVLCPVVRQTQLAALSSLHVADNSNPNLGTAVVPGAPVLDPDTLQFRPTVVDPKQAEQRIRDDARSQALEIDAVSVSGSTVTVYVANEKYYFEAEAIGRLARILLSDCPGDVEVFRIVSVYHGVPMRETKLLRSDMERIITYHGSVAEMRDSMSILDAPMDNPVLDAQNDDYPRFGWSLYPRLARSFFDPKAPARFGVFADASGYVEVLPGITVEAVVEGNLYNNLSNEEASSSLLPHVRSDFNFYYKDGANGISSLDAVWRTRLAPDFFAEVKAGYLEDMFMGAGGQVLWRPNGDRVTFGADVYQVWQRSFDRLFGILSKDCAPPASGCAYNVTTGHVSVYYESPWYGLNFQLHGGRYLAGDWGGTIQISRRFESGIELGAFATFTNVPFAKFGEGSFDKGVIVRIPLEWAVPINTQSEANLDFRPLTRDGGQRLNNDDSLYYETRRQSYGEIDSHLNDIVSP
jgi:hypothetical protein